MKSILLAAVLDLLVAIGANAQVYPTTPKTITASIGWVAPASASNCASTAIIDCRLCKDVAIEMSTKSDGADTTTTQYVWAKSIDGSVWSNQARDHIVTRIDQQGATRAYAVTNVPVASYGYLKLLYITNSGSANITNMSVRAITKRGAS